MKFLIFIIEKKKSIYIAWASFRDEYTTKCLSTTFLNKISSDILSFILCYDLLMLFFFSKYMNYFVELSI